MSESHPQIKELEKTKRIVRGLYTEAVDTKDVVAWHGTSIEVIEEIMKTGYVRGAEENDFRRLYASPVVENTPGLWMSSVMGDTMLSVEDVESYAHENAVSHFLMKRLGGRIGTKNSFSKPLHEILEASIGFLKRVADTPDEFEDKHNPIDMRVQSWFQQFGKERCVFLFKKAIERKGVIIGLNKNIFHNIRGLRLNPSHLHFDEGDISVDSETAQGFPLTCVQNIRPLGTIERQYLSRI